MKTAQQELSDLKRHLNEKFLRLEETLSPRQSYPPHAQPQPQPLPQQPQPQHLAQHAQPQPRPQHQNPPQAHPQQHRYAPQQQLGVPDLPQHSERTLPQQAPRPPQPQPLMQRPPEPEPQHAPLQAPQPQPQSQHHPPHPSPRCSQPGPSRSDRDAFRTPERDSRRSTPQRRHSTPEPIFPIRERLDDSSEFSNFLKSCAAAREQQPQRAHTTPPSAFLMRAPAPAAAPPAGGGAASSERGSSVSPAKPQAQHAATYDNILPHPLQVDVSDPEELDLSLRPCRHCGRSFRNDRIGKHESVCDKGKIQATATTPRRAAAAAASVTPASTPRNSIRMSREGRGVESRHAGGGGAATSASAKKKTPTRTPSKTRGDDAVQRDAATPRKGMAYQRATSLSADHARKPLSTSTPRLTAQSLYERCGSFGLFDGRSVRQPALRERPSAKLNEGRGSSAKPADRWAKRREMTPPPPVRRGAADPPATPATPPAVGRGGVEREALRKPDTPPAEPPANPSPQRSADLSRVNRLGEARRKMKEGRGTQPGDAVRYQMLQEIEDSLLTPRRSRRGSTDMSSPLRAVRQGSPEKAGAAAATPGSVERGLRGRASNLGGAVAGSPREGGGGVDRSYQARRDASREARDRARRDTFEAPSPTLRPAQPSPGKITDVSVTPKIASAFSSKTRAHSHATTPLRLVDRTKIKEPPKDISPASTFGDLGTQIDSETTTPLSVRLDSSTSSSIEDMDKAARARACVEELRRLGFSDAAAIVEKANAR